MNARRPVVLLVAVLALMLASAGDAARAAPDSPSGAAGHGCGQGRPLRLHFYDVGQGLAALVDMPDGRHVLADTGDGAHRRGCGEICASSERHLLDRVRADLAGAPIDVLWITHQHSDHMGAAADVIDTLPVRLYVDNGRDAQKSDVARTHRAAAARGVPRRVVDPDHPAWPLEQAGEARIEPVVPPAWPATCAHDANDCSIGLRIDFCASSVLLLGDAEHAEETAIDTRGPVTLLQVAHHGSATSTTPGFLARARPRYAVVSVGRPGAGLNAEYCLPRAIVIERLTRVLGGGGVATLQAFDGSRCDQAQPSDWIAVPTSDRLWATERDGDVVLSTRGDGVFVRD